MTSAFIYAFLGVLILAIIAASVWVIYLQRKIINFQRELVESAKTDLDDVLEANKKLIQISDSLFGILESIKRDVEAGNWESLRQGFRVEEHETNKLPKNKLN